MLAEYHCGLFIMSSTDKPTYQFLVAVLAGSSRYPLPAYLSIIINVYVTYRELIAMQCKL